MRRRIRITESQLRRTVNEAVNKLLESQSRKALSGIKKQQAIDKFIDTLDYGNSQGDTWLADALETYGIERKVTGDDWCDFFNEAGEDQYGGFASPFTSFENGVISDYEHAVNNIRKSIGLPPLYDLF